MHKILVIDDDLTVTRLLDSSFTKEGFEVLLAKDGVDGATLARDEQPSVIIMDLMMPNLDGMSAIQYLKRDSQTQSIPVIILTSQEGLSGKLEGFGAVAYFNKPIEFGPMLAKVKSIIEGS